MQGEIFQIKKIQSYPNNPGFMNSGIRDINGTFQDLGLKVMQNQLLWSHQCHEIKPKPKKKPIIKIQNNLKWAILAAVKKIPSFVKLTEKVIKVMATQPKLCASKLKLSDRRVHWNKVLIKIS